MVGPKALLRSYYAWGPWRRNLHGRLVVVISTVVASTRGSREAEGSRERERERDEVNAKTSYRVTGREEAATRQTSFIGYFLRDGQVERYSASKTPTVCFRSLQCERHGAGFFLFLEEEREKRKRDHCRGIEES